MIVYPSAKPHLGFASGKGSRGLSPFGGKDVGFRGSSRFPPFDPDRSGATDLENDHAIRTDSL